MSSGSDGVLYGRCEQGGAQPAGEAGRAGDEVDGEPGDGVPQRLHRVGGEPLAGPAPRPGRGAGTASCDTPRVVTIVRARVVVAAVAVRVRVRAVQGDAGRGQREADDLIDHPHVRVPGHHRFGDRVTRGRLGVLPGQVARLAGRAAQPHFLGLRRAGALPQLRERDMHRDMGVRARPVRHHLRADQQLTAGLQRVVEPLPLGPGILGPAFLPSASSTACTAAAHSGVRLPRITPAPPNVVAGLHVPVVEPVLIGVGPRARATFQARPRRSSAGHPGRRPPGRPRPGS